MVKLQVGIRFFNGGFIIGNDYVRMYIVKHQFSPINNGWQRSWHMVYIKAVLYLCILSKVKPYV